MVSDINNINSSPAGKPNRSSSDGVESKEGLDTSLRAGASANTSSSDTVVLSNESQALSRIQDQLKAAPEVNEARVAELREQIASGKYTVDPQKLANRILTSEQGF